MTKQIIVIVGFSLTIALLATAGLVYLGFDISANVKKIEAMRSDLDFNARITQSLSQLKADLDSAKPYLGTLDKILSNRDQVVKFTSDVSALAKANSVKVISKFSSETRNAGGLSSIGVNMEIEGTNDNFINYLKALENSRYSVKFNTIDFYYSAGMVKPTMTGSVFYYDE